MRRLIALKCQPRRAGQPAETRAFVMTEEQAAYFEGCVVALMENEGCSRSVASIHVEKLLTTLLAGRMPPENSPTWLMRLRAKFPKLTRRQLRTLKRAGCPQGRIRAFVVQLAKDDGPKRTVLVSLDDDQSDWFRDAIREGMERDQMTKDEAWMFAIELATRFLTGQTLKEQTDDLILLRAAGLFQPWGEGEFEALPEATETDLLEHSFTEDRSHG